MMISQISVSNTDYCATSGLDLFKLLPERHDTSENEANVLFSREIVRLAFTGSDNAQNVAPKK